MKHLKECSDNILQQITNNIMILKIINIRQPITYQRIAHLLPKVSPTVDIKKSLHQLKTRGLIDEASGKFFSLLKGRNFSQATNLRKRQDIDRMLYLAEEIRRAED